MTRDCRNNARRGPLTNRSCIRPSRCTGVTSSEFMTARIETPVRFAMRRYLLTLSLGFGGPVLAGDDTGAINAYRHAHGLPAVRLDGRLSAVALKQARAMASTGTVSHSAGGNFAARVALLRKTRAAE